MIIFTAAAIAATCILGGLGCKATYMAYNQERETVYSIAGNVLSQYPRAEGALADAVMNPQEQTKKRGAKIMSRYGYDNDAPLSASYRKTLAIYGTCLILMLLLILCYA